MEKSSKLPSLSDLQSDTIEAYKHDQLNLLLNQQPPQSWVKVNKYANNANYLPIDKIEHLLTRIFQRWRVEVIGYSQLFNSVSCHIRLHYLNPVTGQWDFHDGVGASDVQVKSGSTPADLGNINKNAVGMALPIAKSYAIKDASHHLGKLFGKDLNRKDTLDFQPQSEIVTVNELYELFQLAKPNMTAEEIEQADRIIKTNETKSFKKLKSLLYGIANK